MAVEKENVTPKGVLLVVSGPSGAGKGTICQMLREQLPDLGYSISVTTRQPRVGEVDGKSYFFKTVPQVQDMIAKGELLEYAEVYGNYYGTPAAEVDRLLAAGKNVILEIDTQGAMKVKSACPHGVSIFILPPSFAELEKRIIDRGTEAPEVRNRRLSCAKAEMELASRYDYSIINDSVEKAAARILNIISEEHKKRGC